MLTAHSGISLLEDGNVTPYDNPLVTNFHVPLVFVSIYAAHKQNQSNQTRPTHTSPQSSSTPP